LILAFVDAGLRLDDAARRFFGLDIRTHQHSVPQHADIREQWLKVADDGCFLLGRRHTARVTVRIDFH